MESWRRNYSLLVIFSETQVKRTMGHKQLLSGQKAVLITRRYKRIHYVCLYLLINILGEVDVSYLLKRERHRFESWLVFSCWW